MQAASTSAATDSKRPRDEANNYAAVSFARLVEIADALNLTIHYDVRLTQAG